MLWILYFLCVIAPFTVLLPMSRLYFVFWIVAFFLPLVVMLISNKIKNDTPYVIMPAKSLKMKRVLYHPVFSLFIATSMYTVFAVAAHHLETYDMLSRPIGFFREAFSALTSGTNSLVGLFIFLPVGLAVLVYFLKWAFSHGNKGLRFRGFIYILFYVLSVAVMFLPIAFLDARPSDYIKFINSYNNKMFLILLLGLMFLIDAIITLSIACKWRKNRKLAKLRLARLHDKESFEDYSKYELKVEEGYQIEKKKADKAQKKLLKKVQKQNKRIHKAVANLPEREVKPVVEETPAPVEEAPVEDKPELTKKERKALAKQEKKAAKEAKKEKDLAKKDAKRETKKAKRAEIEAEELEESSD